MAEQNKMSKLLGTTVIFVLIMVLASFAYKHLSTQYLSSVSTSVDNNSAQDSRSDSPDDGPNLLDLNAQVYTEEGDTLNLVQIADGKPLVVNFWATWCPYCVREMPDFQDFVVRYDGQINFAFIDACDGTRETSELASQWLKDNGFELPAYYDVDFDAISRFGIRSYPTTVVFDSEGRVVSAAAGQIDPNHLRAILDTLN